MKRLEAPANIVDAIRKKERQENRRKWRRYILAGSVVVVVGGLAFAGSQLLNQGDNPSVAYRQYHVEELTMSQLSRMLEADPSPILVVGKSGMVDTIRREEEFRLLLAAMNDQVPNAAAEQLTPTNTSLPVIQETVSQPTQARSFSDPLTEADVMPSFPGGEAALYRFLSNHLRYPPDALRNKVEGKVFLRFVINDDGSVSDVRVVRSLGFGCDEEALRVVRMMPAWVPGELAGQKVPVYSSLAVNFKFL